MPELPEVEIVCRNLAEMIPNGRKITDWKFYRKDLRFVIPQKQLRQLIGLPLQSIRRRAKYILFDFSDFVLISHLGMTGAWRKEAPGWKKEKHDHLSFVIDSGPVFVFSDPRRFGFIEVVKKTQLQKRFEHIGVEPLDPDTDWEVLTSDFLNLKSPIKSSLMDQKRVVGIGNIYASEILFSAQVSPLRMSGKVTKKEYGLIWKQTKKVLAKAISKGGSTIENYKNSYGEKGDFQSEFKVYGRENEKCHVCGSMIKQKVMAGRSTFWCPGCQE
ncbi:MAG: bifunctional DNA-formamidopyrimidine glycosylase/DNA-(apurinic or apyrimidinic site) lyase [Pseudobdellovibrio sp.]